jgi:hypothetical protein
MTQYKGEMPPVCPYCGAKSTLWPDSHVYRRGYDSKVWCCDNWPVCDSYVGVHPDTNIPLGRLANKELRNNRIAYKRVFNFLWQDAMKSKRYSKGKARTAAYRWLAEQLQIKQEDCHFGWWDNDMVIKAGMICINWVNSQPSLLARAKLKIMDHQNILMNAGLDLRITRVK